jgi:hypothetical protein
MGYSQLKIANLLNVSQSLISLDISLLRQRAREALTDYLENKLPLIFQESMAGISEVILQTWEIIDNPNVSHPDRLHALSLVADCNERRLDMASNGSIIEDGIRFVQEAKQRLVQIAPESAKEMLHKQEEQENVQQQQQPQTQSESKDNNNCDNVTSSTTVAMSSTSISATTIEELVNQLEAFVAKDSPKLYFNIHTQMRNLFLRRMNIKRSMLLIL